MAGIIKNDSPRYVHLKPERFQSEDKSYYTVVEIEEAGELEEYGTNGLNEISSNI